MKPTNETPKNSTTGSPHLSQNPVRKQSKNKVDDSVHSTTHVDLGRANFANRKHGRTTTSLGPNHEPGTV